jgi:multiple sugar transport system ATP-binding protein
MTMGDRIAVMRDGLLQQVGRPQDLYDHPVNVFVAGFIGSPAMNFATVAATEGADLMFGGAKLELAGEQARAAETRPKGANLLIGFRPEHIEIANGQGGSAVRFPATVDVVEYLGNEELIHAQAEGNEIVAMLPSEARVKVGDRVDLAVPMEKLHIFDPESEKTLAG